MDTSSESSVLITAIGNPNIDITVKVNDTYFFEKYNLLPDGHRPVSIDILNTIKNDIKKRKYEVFYSPGGCAQNTLRVFQWLVNKPFESIIIGSIGIDEEGEFLESELSKAGVKTIYAKLKACKTSSVVILTNNGNRSAVYELMVSAACQYSSSHLLETEPMSALKNSKIVHLEAFFTIHSPEVGIEALKICSENNILTSFNLCGEYVVQRSRRAVIPYAEQCDIVIGNSKEFSELCRVLEIDYQDIEQALKNFLNMTLSKMKEGKKYFLKNMSEYGKIVVITNGEQPVYCVTKKHGVVKWDVPVIEKHLIKDTIGAGDSFLAGFLYGILQEFSITQCLEMGCRTSRETIQNYGCILPDKDSSVITNNLFVS